MKGMIPIISTTAAMLNAVSAIHLCYIYILTIDACFAIIKIST